MIQISQPKIPLIPHVPQEPQLLMSKQNIDFMQYMDKMLNKLLYERLKDYNEALLRVNFVKHREFDPNKPIIQIKL